jgi:uncharacterized repeat protein (TIGR04076 family)
MGSLAVDSEWYIRKGADMNKISKCKITVLKKALNKDFAEKFLESEYSNISLCDCFQEGDGFIIDLSQPVNDFEKKCPHAWLDICRDVSMISYGADIPGYKDKGTMISSCTDWFRPVQFKIERI